MLKKDFGVFLQSSKFNTRILVSKKLDDFCPYPLFYQWSFQRFKLSKYQARLVLKELDKSGKIQLSKNGFFVLKNNGGDKKWKKN